MRERCTHEQRTAMLPTPERCGQEGAAERAGTRRREEPGELDRPDAEHLRLRGKELYVRAREQRRRDAQRDDPAQYRVPANERQALPDRIQKREPRSIVDDRLRMHQQERNHDRQVRDRVDEHETATPKGMISTPPTSGPTRAAPLNAAESRPMARMRCLSGPRR